MVTRRQYFSITIMMLVLFCMFQGASLLKQKWDAGNPQEASGAAKLTQDSAFCMEGDERAVMENGGRYAVFVSGGKEAAVENTVRQWCLFNRLELLEYPSLTVYQRSKEHPPLILLLDAQSMDWEQELEPLKELVEQGADVIFCNLPDAAVIQEKEGLRELLGIDYVRTDSIEVDGIHLFGGFLLGGEVIYEASQPEEEKLQDLDRELPWYLTLRSAKVYMGGTLKENHLENEELPSVIWRNSVGSRRIFAVNGDYLEDVMGIGILNAMLYEVSDCQIYPVVNAQNLVAADYPVLSGEGAQDMMRLYSRDTKAVSRDVLWPGLASVAQRAGLKLSVMTAPQLDYEGTQQPDAASFSFYAKMLREYQGEAGLSGNRLGETSITGKLEKDRVTLEAMGNQEDFSSLYLPGDRMEEDLKELEASDYSFRTLVSEYDPQGSLLSYASHDTTLQQAVTGGFSHTYSEDLRVRCLETALGYSSILLDMERVVCPKSEEDAWEKLSEQFSRNTLTYWKAFGAFEATTLSESDSRIRRFLALEYTALRQEDVLSLTITSEEFPVSAQEPCWFLLRTHGEKVRSADGGSASQVEEDVWLIEAWSREVTLSLKESR